MTKRLFTFGCSYTNYAWPTYSNFLSIKYEEYFNWGFPGLGNRGIAERVAECCVRENINKDDLVIVQWSSHIRNDWYNIDPNLPNNRGGWRTRGSIFNYLNLGKIYDRKWVDTFWFEPAYVMHTLNNIRLVQGLLESTGCEYYMTGMGDIREICGDINTDIIHGENISTKPEDIARSKETNTPILYLKTPEFMIYDKQIWQDRADRWLKPINPFVQNFPEWNMRFVDSASKVEYQDYHPTPMQAVLWIEDQLKDRLELSDDNIKDMYEAAKTLHQMQPNYFRDKDTFLAIIGKRGGKFSVESFPKLIFPFPYQGF